MEWYYAKDGKQEGPVSAAQLRQLAAAGKLEPTDMVFKTGSKDWVEASTIHGLFPTGRSAAVAASPPPATGSLEFEDEGEKVVPPTRRKAARDRVEADDEDAPRARSKGLESIPFLDYILFQRTIQAWAIPVIFWSMVLYILYQAAKQFYYIVTNLKFFTFGLMIDFLGLLIAGALSLLALRVSFEVMRTVFQIHETLVENKNSPERQRDK